jgi:hypothetical protein
MANDNGVALAAQTQLWAQAPELAPPIAPGQAGPQAVQAVHAPAVQAAAVPPTAFHPPAVQLPAIPGPTAHAPAVQVPAIPGTAAQPAPAVPPTAVHPPAVQLPTIPGPAVRAPVGQAPAIPATTVQGLAINAPAAQIPAIQVFAQPSQAPQIVPFIVPPAPRQQRITDLAELRRMAFKQGAEDAFMGYMEDDDY